jgi:hypothetical protein
VTRAASAAVLQRGEALLALQAKDEPVDAAIVSRRLEYLAALDEPARADPSGKWSGTMWTSDGQIDLVTMVLEKRGAGYEGTLADTLGLIPAGTKTLDASRTGDELTLSFKIPLEGGMVIRVSLRMQAGTMNGRWVDVKGGNSGPVELARSVR